MMNFVHLADTHLCGSNFKLKQREEDFLDSFRQVVDYCIKEKPEFIVHSGDFFDKGKPRNNVLLFAINQLKRLKEADIKFFVIPGSHDMSVDGTFITILERVGLLTNVAKPENYEQQGDKFLMKGEETDSAIIYGVPGQRANIQRIYQSLEAVPSNKFRVFMFHHITSNVMGTEEFADIPLSLLPKGMDYYAGGHWHEHEVFNYEGKPFIYPGSTEYHNIDSMEKNKPRGFIHYKNKPVFIKLKTREVIIKNIDCNRLSPEEITNKCINNLARSENGLIVLKLQGVLSKGLRNEVDIAVIKERAISKGYLYCNVRLSGLSNPGESVNTKTRTIDEIENEFLKKKGYDKNQVRIAIQLIDLLGKDYKSSQIERVIEKAEEII